MSRLGHHWGPPPSRQKQGRSFARGWEGASSLGFLPLPSPPVSRWETGISLAVTWVSSDVLGDVNEMWENLSFQTVAPFILE